MINTMIAMHTITSANTTMNIAPPAATAAITNIINITNVIARIVNSIIQTPPSL